MYCERHRCPTDSAATAMQSQCTNHLPVARVITNKQSKSFQDNNMPGDRCRAANPERNLRAPVEIQVTELTRIANESKRNTLCALWSAIVPPIFRNTRQRLGVPARRAKQLCCSVFQPSAAFTSAGSVINSLSCRNPIENVSHPAIPAARVEQPK